MEEIISMEIITKEIITKEIITNTLTLRVRLRTHKVFTKD